MRKKQAFRLFSVLLAFLLLAAGTAARLLYQQFPLQVLKRTSHYTLLLAVVMIIAMTLGFLVEHRLHKGWRYFWNHWRIKNRLERDLIDANICIERGKLIEVPKIKLSFEKDMSAGTLQVRNALKFDNKLDSVVMSSALGRFAQERHYQTDDGDWYIYELLSSASFKQTFNSINSFLDYSTSIHQYHLFMDKRTTVKLQHTLLVGQTGSGKTYATYGLVLQMLYKTIPYQLFFADPKGSSLAVVGEVVSPERTAVEIDEIITLLEQFVSLMRERKLEVKELLTNRLDADYSDFGLSPYVLIFDEYASFASILGSYDKKVRDAVKSSIYELILQGRQLGFFMVLTMQKSDASLIDTAIRDNMPLKIVLGNAEQQTYVTAFGTGITIPKRHYEVGEGVFTDPAIAPEPKLVQMPMFSFDVMNAFHQSPRDVITGAPE